MKKVSGDAQRRAISLAIEILQDAGIEARMSPVFLGDGEVHAMIILPDVHMAVMEREGRRSYAIVEEVTAPQPQ